MAVVIRMPKMSDTMTEGVIVSWHKKEGDVLKPGDILADVETDKATMELENFEKGSLLYIGIKEGQAVPVDSIIAIVGQPGEDFKPLLEPGKKPTSPNGENENKAAVTETSNTLSATVPSPATESAEDLRIKASPLARKIAAEKGIQLQALKGSGENGRIIKRDLDSYNGVAASVGSPTVTGGALSFEEVPVTQMRKTIARRLLESKNGAPHFYLTLEINMDKVLANRKTVNEVSEVKISVNDFIIKACAEALTRHPMVNSSWLGDKIRINKHINIGVAVAVEDGLLVPVVRFANTKKLSQISKEVKEFADKAKNKKLQPSDWEGNTFSISNLGMFGIDEFTAIINPPDACILAVGAVKETVIVKEGSFVAANMMKVTLSCDHRVVDGATGAAFLKTLKELLEDPIKIIL